MFNKMLVSGNELNSVKRKKNDIYEYIKVSPAQLEEKSDEGWELFKELKNDLKLKREKVIDEQFCNDIWVTFASIGFVKLNRNRDIQIDYKLRGEIESKKIDVLAIDNETVLVVICKASDHMRVSNLSCHITEYNKATEGLRNVLRGNFPGKKVCFIFATYNYQLSDVDKQLLEESHLHYFNEKTIKYYKELAKHLGKSSRYQLLGNLLANTRIDGMPNQVPAIEGKMGGLTYYSFNIEPEKLLKFGYILHRNEANSDLMPTYQRLIKKSRLNKIRAFVNQGGYFPNSVIVNIDRDNVRFDKASMQIKGSNSKIGILHLPSSFRSTYIIDGQHRLYGYADTAFGSKNTIPVIAFIGLEKKEQVRLFMEINENQKTVSKNLQNTLNANLLWDSSNENDKRKALRLMLAQELGERVASPLYERVIIGENESSKTKCITIESINSALDKSEFLNHYDKNNNIVKEGVLDLLDSDLTIEKIFNVLKRSLLYFSTNCSAEWKNGELDNGILTINVGVYALIKVISDVIKIKTDFNVLRPKTDSVETIFMAIKKEMVYLSDYINSITDEDRLALRKTYGGGGKVKAWRMFQIAIQNEDNDFEPEGLNKWKRDNTKMFNEKSFTKINEIDAFVKEGVQSYLLNDYEESWRYEIPRAIYDKAQEKANSLNFDKGNEEEKIDVITQLTLEDCRDIIMYKKHWKEHFSIIYTRPSEARKKAGTKTSKTKWMKILSDIKVKLSDSGYSVSEENYELIMDVHNWLINEGAK